MGVDKRPDTDTYKLASGLGPEMDGDIAARNEACRDSDVKTIGEVAREFGLTLRTLRFYESMGLIRPERRGEVRLYSSRDRERIGLVLTGRRLGFTLSEIRELLRQPDGQRLQLSRRQCIEQITFLERQKRGIEVALGELRQLYSTFYKAMIDERPSH